MSDGLPPPHIQPSVGWSLSVGYQSLLLGTLQQTGRYEHRWRKCRAGSIIITLPQLRWTEGTTDNNTIICGLMSPVLPRKICDVLNCVQGSLGWMAKVGYQFWEADRKEVDVICDMQFHWLSVALCLIEIAQAEFLSDSRLGQMLMSNLGSSNSD